MNKNHSLFTIRTFAKVSTKRYFRDPVALFFTVVFPLIFLFIFGNIFGKGGNVSVHVALMNQSDTAYAQQIEDQIRHQPKLFKIDKEATTLEKARDKLSRSEIDAAIVLPAGFGEKSVQYPSGTALVYYDQNSEQAARTVTAILQAQFDAVNTKLVKNPIPLKVESKSTNQSGLTSFDYVFSGLIGFSILGLGVFGPVNYFPQMKKQGILRRLHITPLRVWEYFISSAMSNSVIGLFSIAIMFLAAFVFFNFHLAGNIIELIVIVTLGIIVIFGIGLAIGGWAKNENQAAPLANIIAFPMMFLSGTFFPRFLMPEWLQNVTAFLPLTPVIDGIRMVATEGKHLWEIGPQLALILIWTIIIYGIAFRVFRWE
jgi:ABC-2 type transport system permease protein